MPEPDERGHVILHLSTSQYEAVMYALEAVSTGRELPQDVVGSIRSVWLRQCYEGGHLSLKEMQKIRKELKVAGP